MNDGEQVSSGGGHFHHCPKKSHGAAQGDAVDNIDLCSAATATLAEKFLIVIKGGTEEIP